MTLKVNRVFKKDLKRILTRCLRSVGVLCDDLQKVEMLFKEVLAEISSHSGPVVAFTLLYGRCHHGCMQRLEK